MEISSLLSGELVKRLDISQVENRRRLGAEKQSRLTKPNNFRFEEDVYNFLKGEAELLKIDVTDLIRFGLRKWVEAELEIAEKLPPSKLDSIEERLEKIESMLASALTNKEMEVPPTTEEESSLFEEEKVSLKLSTSSVIQEINQEVIQEESSSVNQEVIQDKEVIQEVNEPVVGSKFTANGSDYRIWDIREVEGVKQYFFDKDKPDLSVILEYLKERATFTSHPSKPMPIIKMDKPKKEKQKISRKDWEELVEYSEEFDIEPPYDDFEICDD